MAIISKAGMKEIEMRAAEELARRGAARDRSSKEDRDEAEGAEDGYARGGVVAKKNPAQPLYTKQLTVADDFARHRGPHVKAR